MRRLVVSSTWRASAMPYLGLTAAARSQDETRIVQGLQHAFPVADQDEALKMALQGGAGSPDDTPIFVVGLPRSGSTLVEQILASHPSVYGAGGAPQ